MKTTISALAVMASLAVGGTAIAEKEKSICDGTLIRHIDFITEFPGSPYYTIDLSRHDNDFLNCMQEGIRNRTEYEFLKTPVNSIGLFQGIEIKKYVTYDPKKFTPK